MNVYAAQLPDNAEESAPSSKNGLSFDRLVALGANANISKDEVLKAVTDLYGATLISYPYTRGTTMPARELVAAPEILATIRRFFPDIALPPEGKTPAPGFYVEEFREAHHAIVPREFAKDAMRNLPEISATAVKVYRIVAEAYLRVYLEG